MNDAADMKYMECCLKESLRLYSTVPNIVRKTAEEIELNGYKIPAGISVCIQMYGLHRNPEHFPDPLTYDPDRFQPERCSGRHPYAFIPFSAGPRNCLGLSELCDSFILHLILMRIYICKIGQKFASLEAKVIISSLLRKFYFSYSPHRDPLQIDADLVLKYIEGVPLIVSTRY